jgi:hypothetical protein
VHAIQMEIALSRLSQPTRRRPGASTRPRPPASKAALSSIIEAALDAAAIHRTEPRMTRIDNSRVIRSPRGTELSAKSWLTEAPLRMLMNNLDPDVAEKPGELVVYGGIGRAARTWEDFDRIVASCARSRPTRPCWCSRASRSASSRPMRTRRAC